MLVLFEFWFGRIVIICFFIFFTFIVSISILYLFIKKTFCRAEPESQGETLEAAFGFSFLFGRYTKNLYLYYVLITYINRMVYSRFVVIISSSWNFFSDCL
jgi:hypothetical protein